MQQSLQGLENDLAQAEGKWPQAGWPDAGVRSQVKVSSLPARGTEESRKQTSEEN
jgi:hypothetical protein